MKVKIAFFLASTLCPLLYIALAIFIQTMIINLATSIVTTLQLLLLVVFQSPDIEPRLGDHTTIFVVMIVQQSATEVIGIRGIKVHILAHVGIEANRTNGRTQ